MVVGFICLEFGNGRWGIKYTTFIKIHYDEYFIIGYWAKYQIIIVLNTFTTVNNKVQPCLIRAMKLTNI